MQLLQARRPNRDTAKKFAVSLQVCCTLTSGIISTEKAKSTDIFFYFNPQVYL